MIFEIIIGFSFLGLVVLVFTFLKEDIIQDWKNKYHQLFQEIEKKISIAKEKLLKVSKEYEINLPVNQSPKEENEGDNHKNAK